MIHDTGIRLVRSDDLETISTLIRNTLLISNGVDYDFRIIKNLTYQYAPNGVAEMARKREMYVYDSDGMIAGTQTRQLGSGIEVLALYPDHCSASGYGWEKRHLVVGSHGIIQCNIFLIDGDAHGA